MAWHAIDPAIPGEVISAAFWNEQLGDNLSTLRTGGIALPGQATFDWMYANGPTSWARLPPPQNYSNVPMFRYNVGMTTERALGTHELFLPASAFRPSGSTGYPAGWHQTLTLSPQVVSGNPCELLVMPFRHDVTSGVQDAYAQFALPNSWDDAVQYYFSVFMTTGPTNASPAGFVAFAMNLECGGHGANMGNWNGLTPGYFGTYEGGRVTVSARFAAPMVAPGPNRITSLFVRRYYGQWGDTLAGTAYLIGIKLFFVRDHLTDD